MDKVTRAVERLWGTLGPAGELHAAPRFQDELRAEAEGDLFRLERRVSEWSFGHHVEHLYQASHWVLDRLEESMSGANADGKMNHLGIGMLILGRIPRGMYPTIPPLMPQGGTMAEIRPLAERLRARLAEHDWRLPEVLVCPGRSRHPRMRFLAARHWMIFLDIHHRHHRAILRDILKAGVRVPLAEAA